MILQKKKFIIIILSLLAIFNLSVFLNLNYYSFRAVYTFLFAALVPGFLLTLILKLRRSDFWELLVYSTGLGISFLIFTGFWVNAVLSYFGIDKPLSPINLTLGFDIFFLLLLLVFIFRSKRFYLKIEFPKINLLNSLFLFIATTLPVLAVLGAISLNNNLYNSYTITMLGISGFWILALFVFNKKLERSIFPASLFFISLSLLLMTSLRGWYTTGHDNQLEYFVYRLTSSDYKWDITNYRDPYNASLSITILPTVYYSLTGINEAYVFKILFQIIFSLIGVSIFLLFERYVSRTVAALSVFSFLSFPTFVNDMPMLNRQELAMLYFSLMLLSIFNKKQKAITNQILFVIFGFAMVTSHYSTTYIAIGLFLFVYITFLFVRIIHIKYFKRIIIGRSKPRLSFLAIAIIIAFTLFWNVQLTNTTAGLSRVITETYKNIGKSFSQDLKSGGIYYSLFSFKTLNKDELLNEYVRTAVNDARQKFSEEELYDENITNSYALRRVEDIKSAPSVYGKFLEKNGISPFYLNFYIRQITARSLQLFMIIGSFVILFGKSKYISKIDREYVILVFGSFIVLVFFIFLPVLSIEYGTQRLFQQALTACSLSLVIGFIYIFGRYLTTFIVFFVFLSLSGFFPYMTGGYFPQLNLYNNGAEYDSYYTHGTEVASMDWLSKNYNNGLDVYSNSSVHAKLAANEGIFTLKELLPSAITKNSYVYLDLTNTTKNIDYISYKGDLIIYDLPQDFFNTHKNLIYTNGKTKIYR